MHVPHCEDVVCHCCFDVLVDDVTDCFYAQSADSILREEKTYSFTVYEPTKTDLYPFLLKCLITTIRC